MARRLVHRFLEKKDTVRYFDDADLDAAADAHEHIRYFCDAALGAPWPYGIQPPPGKIGIHQALKAAGWDISKLIVPTDLGVPAFNNGSKLLNTDDFANDLGLMINGVQHAYAIAAHYVHDPVYYRYCINFKFLFYDVFGLDDEDSWKYGADDDVGDSYFAREAQGITAWWQLQHQFGYAPLVTKFTVHRTYEIPTVL
jgi:hypothetical protein